MKTISVERRDNLSTVAFKRDFLAPQRPVVIRGAFDAWPARQRWSFAYFRERYGTHPVDLDDSGEPGSPNDGISWIRDVRSVRLPLSSFLDMIEAGAMPRKYYLGGLQLKRWFAGLEDDLRPLPFLSGMLLDFPGSRLGIRLLLGPGGTVTPLHIDQSHNFLLQVAGSKRLIVFPASQAEHNLYIPSPDLPATGERHAIRHAFSPVDFEKPDLARYPRYAEATPFECVLEPGDMLFLPSKWPHYVRSLSPSITLSYWFKELGMALQDTPKLLSFMTRRLGERLGLFRGRSPV